jgi:hypothetical protein
MNNKSYRLLRNNKEQGPFTADELIAKGLKPYDLIWVDGRSAAWSYPGEMAEFKNYVLNPDDYRNNLIVTKQETIARVSNTVQAAVAMNDNIQTKQKPRYKVSAAWSKIQTITTPIYSDVTVAEPKKSSASKIIDAKNTHPLNSKPLSWEQAWLDWENEKNVVPPVKQQTITTPVKKTINEFTKAEPLLEKKFEQSLDTLTDSYIDNLLLQKKRAKKFSFGKSSEFVLPSIALIVIFSIGYWFLHGTKASAVSSSPVKQQQTVAVNSQPVSNLNTVASNDNQNASSPSAAQQTENNSTLSNKTVDKIEAKEKITSQHTGNTKFITPVKSNTTGNVAANNTQKNSSSVSDIDLKKTGSKESKQFDPSVINNIPGDDTYNDPSSANNGDLNAAENRPVRRRTNSEASNNSPANGNDNNPIINAKAKSAASYVKVPEYVTMANGNGSVKIQNTSDNDLDLVVVDVQYYDASGRFRKGETLYLHNLKAGKTVTIKTPRDVNSSYATSKVSLVSSDANNVYAVGDN